MPLIRRSGARNCSISRAILFAGRNRKADRLEKRLRREVQLLPLRQNIRRQILYAVIEAGMVMWPFSVMQTAEDIWSAAAIGLRAADRPKIRRMQVAIGRPLI